MLSLIGLIFSIGGIDRQDGIDLTLAAIHIVGMHETVGKLPCLRRVGDNEKQNVVLLHGFGADAGDLFPLADFLDPEGKWNFYFPEAPLEVPIGPMSSGRGWFPISVRELEVGIDFTKMRPPGMDASCELVYDMIFHLNSEKLVLGGFSQGAMVSTEVALSNPQDVHGLVLLSGALLDQANWAKKAVELKGKRFIQSHGTGDPVIPFLAAQKLFDLLKGAGMDGQFVSFPGGHEIPMPVLQKSKAFIESILD
jgi:phospholipase/carboxylesterase